VSSLQYTWNFLRFPVSSSNFDEGSGQDPYHIIEKPLSPVVNLQLIWKLGKPDFIKSPDCGLFHLFIRAETFKIMGTCKIPGRLFHCFYIVSFMKGTEIFSFKYIFMAACTDTVSVQLFSSVQAAVKPVGNLTDLEDFNVLRKIMIHIFTDFLTA